MLDIALSNLISIWFGKFASTHFPTPVQNFINESYVKIMKLDMSEFAPPSSYPTLNALFTRKLQKPREFPKDEKSVISPCDALVTEAGDAQKNRALQIKGFAYSIDELLTGKIDESEREKVYDSKYINLYLSPRDYHRYHAPMDMIVKKAVYVPGALYPVNLTYLNRIVNLFIKNERVVLECEDSKKRRFFMVFVGALNVGKMVFDFDERIKTNAGKKKIDVYEYKDPIILKKGDEIGYFMMGSTVVMFFEKGMIDLSVKEGEHVKFGDVIGELK